MRRQMKTLVIVIALAIANAFSSYSEEYEKQKISVLINTNASPFEIMVRILPVFEQTIEARCALLLCRMRMKAINIDIGKMNEADCKELLEKNCLSSNDIRDEAEELFRDIIDLQREGMSSAEIIKELVSMYSKRGDIARSDVITRLTLNGQYKGNRYETVVNELMSKEEKDAHLVYCAHLKSILLNAFSEVMKKEMVDRKKGLREAVLKTIVNQDSQSKIAEAGQYPSLAITNGTVIIDNTEIAVKATTTYTNAPLGKRLGE